MGRYTTGSTTTEDSFNLSIKLLKEHGLLKPNQKVNAIIEISKGSTKKCAFEIEVDTSNDSNIRFIYSISNNGTSEKIKIDYKVYLEKVASNLGKGYRYYFVCPFSGRRCQTLYQAYGSYHFKDRLAYRNYIYYPSQLLSHRDRVFRYHAIKKDIETLREKQFKYMYKGKKTRLTNRIESLEDKYERISDQSLTHLWKKLQKMKVFLK